MAQSITGEVQIDLKGPRILKFNMRALARYQEMAGEPLDDVFLQISDFYMKNSLKEGTALTIAQTRRMLRILTIKKLRDLLMVALMHQEPDITKEDAEDLMDAAKGETLMEKQIFIATALLNAWKAVQVSEKMIAEMSKKKE